MNYDTALTVPANTPTLPPVSTTQVISAGVLQRIDIFFHDGCHRLVCIAIFDGVTQVWPKDVGSCYRENAVIEEMVLNQVAKTYTMYGWSPGTTYDHRITMVWNVLTAEENTMRRAGYI